MQDIENKVGKVGFFKGAIYDNGMPVAYVAAIQEFGYPEGGIPSRSFMRSTIKEQQQTWANLAKNGVRAVIKGSLSGSDLMETIGSKAAGDMRKKITTITSPALAESTVSARLSRKSDKNTVGNLTKPLVDTGLMLASLTYAVESK